MEGNLVLGHRPPPPQGSLGNCPPVKRGESSQALDQARSGGSHTEDGNCRGNRGSGRTAASQTADGHNRGGRGSSR